MMSFFRRTDCACPVSIFFILGNEFCERFSYYGMRAVLMLYLTQDVLIPRDEAKLVYHAVTFLVYFMPLFGALLADNFIGKFNTIWTVSIVYAIGQVLMSLSSIHSLQFPRYEICVVALIIIAIGAGGIKPCVSAFGGDQFEASQYTARDRFYSVFYFFINTGALLSMIISPIFRAKVYCFGRDNCYPLAFGFPAILMVIATVVFICGWKLYKVNPPQGNVVVDVARCIVHAIKRKASTKEKKQHWLDYADDRFDSTTINDIKTALSILLLFVPIPFFWALFDQQGSAWTLQSAQMEGRTAALGEIQPDQMDALNAALVMVLVPIFSFGVYPLLTKFGLLTKPLQRMTAGMLLAAAAFTYAAFVYMSMEAQLVALPEAGKTEIVMHSALPCNAQIELFDTAKSPINLQNYKSAVVKDIDVSSGKGINITGSITIIDGNCPLNNGTSTNFTVQVKDKMAYGVLFHLTENNVIGYEQAEEVRSRDMQTHKPQVRFIHVTNTKNDSRTVIMMEAESGKECFDIGKSFHESTYSFVRSNTKFDYCFAERTGFVDAEGDKRKCPESCSGGNIGSHLFDKGGIFTAILIEDENSSTVWNVITTGQPDSISILNQIPQYFIITCGEVMLSITALSFAYAEAPDSLKSIFQAAWLLTVAFGNVIVVVVDIIKTASGVERESISFFVYAVLMALDMLLFAWLARRYKYKCKFIDESTKM